MKKIEQLQFIKGKIRITKRRVSYWIKTLQRFGLFLNAGRVVSVHEYENVFCNSGKYSILEAMGGVSQRSITYFALGDSVVAPDKTDVELGNETFRKKTTLRHREGNTLICSTFLATGDAIGTFKEMGLYGDDAGAVADSGTLYTHSAIDEAKTGSETITVDYLIEITL